MERVTRLCLTELPLQIGLLTERVNYRTDLDASQLLPLLLLISILFTTMTMSDKESTPTPSTKTVQLPPGAKYRGAVVEVHDP